MMDPTGLPDIFSARFRDAPYNPLRVSRLVWLVQRWWWRECLAEWQRAVTASLVDRRPVAPQWAPIATVAMETIARLGGYAGASLSRYMQSLRRRRHPAPAELRPVSMADEWGRLAAVDWSQLAGESYDAFKDRVFYPLRQKVYGVPKSFVDDYTAKRMPPIRGASEQTRTRVRDVLAKANLEDLPDREVRAALQDAGRWPLARVRNQIRTETSTMYNAGRFVNMATDEAVVAYRYVATIDDRTSDICEALDGEIVEQRDLQAVPPLHHQCRTILEPVFAWEQYGAANPESVPVPGEGAYQQYAGFGQRELVAEYAPRRR